jgi:chromodomain-helicase-DNA-binding protein 4
MEYELYPDGSSNMRAHVVVTSYEAPVDDHSKSFFHKVKWAGLIVDEGQRLKNDKNLLYGALSAMKVPFRVLLTGLSCNLFLRSFANCSAGTPLQNNKRELFNLLQFLDTTLSAAKLDEKFANLTNEDLAHLHKLIRPFFLR